MKCNVIINPLSGKGNAASVWEKIAPIFDHSPISTTAHVTGLGDIGRHLKDCDALIAVGGDGTFHTVVNQLMKTQRNIPLGLIPAGTGNALMTDLGCSGSEEAARRIISGNRRRIDLLEVTTPSETIYAVSVAGWGMFAKANQTAENLRCFKGLRYNVAAMWHIFFKRTHRATLKYERSEEAGDFITIFAANTMYTGKGIKAAPKATIDDGLLDLVTIKNESRLTLLKLFRHFLTGQYLDHNQVTYRQVSAFELKTDGHQILNIDGEMKGCSPFSVRVIPKAIELLL